MQFPWADDVLHSMARWFCFALASCIPRIQTHAANTIISFSTIYSERVPCHVHANCTSPFNVFSILFFQSLLLNRICSVLFVIGWSVNRNEFSMRSRNGPKKTRRPTADHWCQGYLQKIDGKQIQTVCSALYTFQKVERNLKMVVNTSNARRNGIRNAHTISKTIFSSSNAVQWVLMLQVRGISVEAFPPMSIALAWIHARLRVYHISIPK